MRALLCLPILVVSTTAGRAPHWSRDSRTLSFFNPSYGYAASFTPGAPPTIGVSHTIYTRDPWGNSTISPDGQTMMMTDRRGKRIRRRWW